VYYLQPPQEEGEKPTKVEVPSHIDDLDNGKYICKYVPEQEGDYEVRILFQDDKGNMVPLRGSPYHANIKQGFKEPDGKLVGEALKKYIATEIKRLQELMQ
jgi:hypothetical protein